MGGLVSAVAPLGPGSVRPSPLGSYSPVRLQGVTSTSCSTCTPSPQTPRSLSCPLSAGLLPLHHTHPPPARLAAAPLLPTPPPPPLGVKRGAVPPMLPPVQGQVQGQCHQHYHCGTLPILPVVLQDSEISLRYEETSDSAEGSRGPGSRTQHGRCLCLSAVRSGLVMYVVVSVRLLDYGLASPVPLMSSTGFVQFFFLFSFCCTLFVCGQLTSYGDLTDIL